MRNLHVKLPDEIGADLDMIVELTGADQTRIIRGMIEHWAAVVKDQKARGFVVRPIDGASFAAVMAPDRAGELDLVQAVALAPPALEVPEGKTAPVP